MPASTTMTLHGLPATVRKLEQLPQKISKGPVRKAVRAGGAPFVKASKRNAPRRTGIFKRSLTQKVKSYRGGVVTLSIIGQLKRARIKATKGLKKGRGGISGRGGVVPVHFVEEDIKPHRIPKEGTDDPFAFAFRSQGGRIVIVYEIHHPGTRGQHPIRKAAQEAERPGLAAFQQKLATEVDREAAKMAATA